MYTKYLLNNLTDPNTCIKIEDALDNDSNIESVFIDFNNSCLEVVTNKDIFYLNRIIKRIDSNVSISYILYSKKYLLIRLLKLLLCFIIGYVGIKYNVYLLIFSNILILLSSFINFKRFNIEDYFIIISLLLLFIFKFYYEELFILSLYEIYKLFDIVIYNYINNRINKVFNLSSYYNCNGKDTLKELIKVNDVITLDKGDILPVDGILLDKGVIYYSGTLIKKKISLKVINNYYNSYLYKVFNIISNVKDSKSNVINKIDRYVDYILYLYIGIAFIFSFILPLIYNIYYVDSIKILIVFLLVFNYRYIINYIYYIYMVSIINLYKKNIFIRSSKYLEYLSNCNIVVFDKYKLIKKDIINKLDSFSIKKYLFCDKKNISKLNNLSINIFNNLSFDRKFIVFKDILINNYKGNTLYISDGINDESFLLLSDVSLILEDNNNSSDIIVLDNNVDSIYDLLFISRKNKFIIRENIIISLVFKIILILLFMFSIIDIVLVMLLNLVLIVILYFNSFRSFKKK